MNKSFEESFEEAMEFEEGVENLALEDLQESKPVIVLPALAIECIYKYMNLEEVKKCRLVGRAWNLASKKTLKQKGKLVFSKSANYPVLNSMPVEYPADIPFNAFQIARGNNPWSMSEFQEFFYRFNPNIKELTLRNVNFVANKFDFAPWIVNNTIRADIISKLTVASSGTPVSIPLDSFVHVKDLSLKFCDVQVKKGVKITPVKLSLLYVNFIRNRKIVSVVKINDFVDFSKAKEITLEFESLTYNSMELAGEIKLNSLAVRDIKFDNWQASKWEIEKLSITHAPFLLANGMQFKELEFSYGDIEMNALPLSLERLTICNIGGFFEMSYRRPFFFPNLKYVNLKFGNEDNGDIVVRFLNCPKLVEMDLEGSDCGYQEFLESARIAFNWVPKSIKKLTLKNVNFFRKSREDSLNLDELILVDYKYHNRITVKEPHYGIKIVGLTVDSSDDSSDSDNYTCGGIYNGKEIAEIFDGSSGRLQVKTLRLLGDRSRSAFISQEEFLGTVARINHSANCIRRIYGGDLYFWENPAYIKA